MSAGVFDDRRRSFTVEYRVTLAADMPLAVYTETSSATFAATATAAASVVIIPHWVRGFMGYLPLQSSAFPNGIAAFMLLRSCYFM